MRKCKICELNLHLKGDFNESCNFGCRQGTKIANLRFDKKNIEVVLNERRLDPMRRKLGIIMGDNIQAGINSMINIGFMIDNNVFIDVGSVVTGELKSDTRMM